MSEKESTRTEGIMLILAFAITKEHVTLVYLIFVYFSPIDLIFHQLICMICYAVVCLKF